MSVLEAALPLIREPEAAVDLAEQAQFTSDEEIDEGDLTVVEVREIDSGVEDPPALVAGNGVIQILLSPNPTSGSLGRSPAHAPFQSRPRFPAVIA